MKTAWAAHRLVEQAASSLWIALSLLNGFGLTTDSHVIPFQVV